MPIFAWKDWEKNMKNSSQDSRSRGRYLKPGPPKYEAVVLKHSIPKFDKEMSYLVRNSMCDERQNLYLTPHKFSDEMRVRWYDDDDQDH
jgi:hypothetical protein